MLARQIAIGFGIAFIFPLLIHYGVATFYPPPKFQSYVTVTARLLPSNATPAERQEIEEQRKKRQEQVDAFNAAAKDFARMLVLVATPLGVAAILIGSFVALHAIGTGLIFGGIFSIAWGYWGYWGHLDDWLRFVSLLVGFAILLFVGYRMISGARPAASPQ